MTETKRTADFMPLFTRHGRQLYAYFLTLMGNDPGADDVFQETSTLMWEKFEQFEPGTNFVAWGCRIGYFRVQFGRSPGFSKKLPEVFSSPALLLR
jgi:RNA polymerase sigma-70 factor, ECF subfamily